MESNLCLFNSMGTSMLDDLAGVVCSDWGADEEQQACTFAGLHGRQVWRLVAKQSDPA